MGRIRLYNCPQVFFCLKPSMHDPIIIFTLWHLNHATLPISLVCLLVGLFVCLFVCLFALPNVKRRICTQPTMSDIFHEYQFKKSTTIWSTRYGCATWRKHLWLSKQNHENYNSGQRVMAIAAGMVYTSIAEGPCWLAEFTIEDEKINTQNSVCFVAHLFIFNYSAVSAGITLLTLREKYRPLLK